MNDKTKRSYLIGLRKSIGTQEIVARELGISRQLLSMIELGNRNPTVKLMAKLEKYFNTSAKLLLPDLFFEDDCHKLSHDEESA